MRVLGTLASVLFSLAFFAVFRLLACLLFLFRMFLKYLFRICLNKACFTKMFHGHFAMCILQ